MDCNALQRYCCRHHAVLKSNVGESSNTSVFRYLCVFEHTVGERRQLRATDAIEKNHLSYRGPGRVLHYVLVLHLPRACSQVCKFSAKLANTFLSYRKPTEERLRLAASVERLMRSSAVGGFRSKFRYMSSMTP